MSARSGINGVRIGRSGSIGSISSGDEGGGGGGKLRSLSPQARVRGASALRIVGGGGVIMTEKKQPSDALRKAAKTLGINPPAQ